MKPGGGRRRQPRQGRARQTVEAMLAAVLRILRQEGLAGVTTNRIAEVAGVSIGSVYQYFPDKQGLFAVLHDRHVDEIAALVERTLVEHATATLEDLVRALADALVTAHAREPRLHEALASHRPEGGHESRALERRLQGALQLALAARARDLPRRLDLDRAAFFSALLLDGLCHGLARARPPGLSTRAATEEVVRAVMGYLREPLPAVIRRG